MSATRESLVKELAWLHESAINAHKQCQEIKKRYHKSYYFIGQDPCYKEGFYEGRIAELEQQLKRC